MIWFRWLILIVCEDFAHYLYIMYRNSDGGKRPMSKCFLYANYINSLYTWLICIISVMFILGLINIHQLISILRTNLTWVCSRDGMARKVESCQWKTCLCVPREGRMLTSLRLIPSQSTFGSKFMPLHLQSKWNLCAVILSRVLHMAGSVSRNTTTCSDFSAN